MVLSTGVLPAAYPCMQGAITSISLIILFSEACLWTYIKYAHKMLCPFAVYQWKYLKIYGQSFFKNKEPIIPELH